MDGELSELFSKNLKSRSTAVEILNLLEQGGDRNQKSLAEHPKIPEYKLSRILKRLELGRFVIARAYHCHTHNSVTSATTLTRQADVMKRVKIRGHALERKLMVRR